MSKLLNILNNLYNAAGYDGMKHIVLSAVLTVMLKLVFPIYVAVPTVFLVGMLKEIYDKKSGKGCAETKDMVCNIIGIIIGAL